MAGSGHSRLVDDVVAALGRAESVRDVPAAVAEVLGDVFGLCRVSVRAIVPGSAEVEILAVWTRGFTSLEPGVRMPLRSTTLSDVVATNTSHVRSRIRPEDGLLHGILVGEGIRSYATAPLGDVARGAPVLSLSSTDPDAFDANDLSLVDAVAAAVADRIEALAP